jgi:hypothetical protein
MADALVISALPSDRHFFAHLSKYLFSFGGAAGSPLDEAISFAAITPSPNEKLRMPNVECS